MSLRLSDSKAFWHLREGEQTDEGPTESSSLRALRALGLGGMAFRLSGPVVPSVENGAHKAYCPFSLKCSWQWLSWWERRGLGEVEKKAREGSGGWCKNEGGGPTPGTDTMPWEPYQTYTSPPPACRARPGETGEALTPDRTLPAPLHTGGARTQAPEGIYCWMYSKRGSRPSRLSNQFSDLQAAVKKAE